MPVKLYVWVNMATCEFDMQCSCLVGLLNNCLELKYLNLLADIIVTFVKLLQKHCVMYFLNLLYSFVLQIYI